MVLKMEAVWVVVATMEMVDGAGGEGGAGDGGVGVGVGVGDGGGGGVGGEGLSTLRLEILGASILASPSS